MKKTFTILLLLVLHGIVAAQNSLSIKIVDAKDATSIPFAQAFNQTTKVVSTSNEDGLLVINGSPQDSIKITCFGYNTQTTTLADLSTKKTIPLVTKETLLKEVTINGGSPDDKPKPVSIDKLEIKNLDAPTTTNTVDAKIMEQRNVSDLGDALKSATGVRPINRYGGFQTFRIRGFNNFVLLVDGVRDERHNISTSAPSTNLANIERIEVLKGPASVLLGHSALGGVINLVRKKPTDTKTAEFKTTYGSYNTYNMSAGIGGPITEKLKYRVDFGFTRSDGWRDFGVATNNGTATFNYSPTKKDNIEISLQANNDIYDTDTGIPVDENGNVIEGMDPETRYNDPQDHLKHQRKDIQAKYTHQFNDRLKVTEHFAWSNDDINYLSTESLTLNETKDSIQRSFPFYFNHKTNTIQNQLDFTYKFKTGGIEHKSVIGHSLSILDRKTFSGSVQGEGTFTTISVQNPILNQGHIEAVNKKVVVKEEVVNGIYFQDWMNLTEKLKALIGLRYDIFSGTYYQNEINNDRSLISAGEKTTIPSTALTYRAGLVYQPSKTVSLFGSYSNYFKPTRRVTPDKEVFDPETGYQIEGGLKVDKGDLLNLTISTFYMLKNNIVERDSANLYRQIGEADSKGIELDVRLKLIEGLYFKGGYAYVDAKIRGYSGEQKVKEGNQLRFAPEHMANAWLNYEVHNGIVKGLGIGAGLNYVGENYTNSENTHKLPAYTTVDATVYYQCNNVRVGFNANNLGNKLYFTDAIYGNQFFSGMRRNYKVSVAYKF